MEIHENMLINYYKKCTFIHKFSEQLKTHFVFNKVSLKLVHLIRKCIKFCSYRQDRDCNVTHCIVIPYWIIKFTETRWENDTVYSIFFVRFPRMLLRVTLQHILYLFAFSVLLVRCITVCLILCNFNRCLTFVITWCVEEYCDTKRYTCLVVCRIVNRILKSCFI